MVAPGEWSLRGILLYMNTNNHQFFIVSMTAGKMEVLDNNWIIVSDTKCPERDASPATLGLTNMAGK